MYGCNMFAFKLLWFVMNLNIITTAFSTFKDFSRDIIKIYYPLIVQTPSLFNEINNSVISTITKFQRRSSLLINGAFLFSSFWYSSKSPPTFNMLTTKTIKPNIIFLIFMVLILDYDLNNYLFLNQKANNLINGFLKAINWFKNNIKSARQFWPESESNFKFAISTSR